MRWTESSRRTAEMSDMHPVEQPGGITMVMAAKLTTSTMFLHCVENCPCHWWHGCNHSDVNNYSKLRCRLYHRPLLLYVHLAYAISNLTTALWQFPLPPKETGFWEVGKLSQLPGSIAREDQGSSGPDSVLYNPCSWLSAQSASLVFLADRARS